MLDCAHPLGGAAPRRHVHRLPDPARRDSRPYVSVDLPDDEGAAELFSVRRIDLDSDHPIARLHRARRTMLLENLDDATMEAAVGGDPRRGRS